MRLGAFAGGQLAFTGLSGFRGFQGTAGGGVWAALDETESTTSRLDLEWMRKSALRSEFAYLTGDRVDATLSQELRIGKPTLGVSYRYRDERIGTLTQAEQLAPCSGGCSQQYVIPFGYSSHTAAMSARAVLGPRLELGAGGGLERRAYHADSFLLLRLSDGSTSELDHRRRQDQRWFAGLWAGVRVSPRLELTMRYDLVVNDSNVARSLASGERCSPTDPSCHLLDYDDKNYTKHVLGLETVLRW